MKNREIYESALRFLAESTAAGDNQDYEERASYLLAAFCTEMSELDRYLQGSSAQAPIEAASLPLTAEFPLSSRLSSAASLYLAAMLILESDEERSDKLYAQYLEAISRIANHVPATILPITDKYF